MKPLRVLAFTFLVAAACAQIAAPPLPQNDPFVGTWQESGGKKASYARTIARDGDELVFSSRWHSSHHNYRIRCDGLFHPVPSGSMSCKYITTNVIEGESRQNRDTIYWKREVSADGQKMTISAYTDDRRTTLIGLPDLLDRVK
jgi:hypothetical protein